MAPVFDGNNIALFFASPLGWFLFLSALVSSALVIFALRRNPWTFIRPAFAFATVLNLLFQWPLAFLAGGIEKTLDNPWPMSVSLLFFVLGSMLWVRLTPRLTLSRDTCVQRELPRGSFWVPTGLAIILGTIYLLVVPLRCTALWAFITDPLLTSMAREVSIKLVASSIATYAFGALANVVLPVVMSLVLVRTLEQLGQRNRAAYVKAFLLLCALVSSLVFILLPGIKGLLIPAGIMLITGILFWVKRPIAKLSAAVLLGGTIAVMIIGFDTLKEREFQSVPYNFLQCSASVGSLPEGEAMLKAIEESGGFGLTGGQIQQLQNNGVIVRSPEASSEEPDDSETGNPDPDPNLPEPGSNSDGQSSESDELPPTSEDSATPPTPDDLSTSGNPGLARYFAYAGGVFNRAFFVPSQIAALHFAYVEDFGSPGLAAAPLAKRLFGESIDMPSLVFQAFVAPASETNKDSTGTAPTTSIFSWVAYFGIIGAALVAMSILIMDIVIALTMRRVDRSMLPVVTGLLFVLLFAMISSDFVTALLSHGGLAAFLLMGFWLIQSEWRRKASLRFVRTMPDLRKDPGGSTGK